MSNYTPIFNLIKPTGSEQFTVEHANENADKLDLAVMKKDGTNSSLSYLDFSNGTRLIIDADKNLLNVVFPDGTTANLPSEFWFAEGKYTQTINEGDLVMLAGSQGDYYTMKKAVAAELATSPHLFMGIATKSGTNGSWGKVTKLGLVNGLNTSAWPFGTRLYFNPATLGLTPTLPALPNARIEVGMVVKQNAGNGSILLNIQDLTLYTNAEIDAKIAAASASNATTANITYYVATTGSNSNNGLAVGTPFQTIAYALSLLPKNIRHTVTINVAAGTYNEVVTVSGFYGEGTININGGADLANAVNYKIDRALIQYCTTGLNITGFEATTTSGQAFNIDNCSKASLTYCTSTSVDAVNSGAYIRNSNAAVSSCLFSNKYSAIYAYMNSQVYSTSQTAGSGNTYGIYGGRGSIVAKNGVQPQGATPEITIGGGIITAGVINPAGLDSPAFIGTPTAPKPAKTLDTPQLATMDVLQDRVKQIDVPAVKAASFTLALADEGQYLLCESASTITVTVPTNATVALPIGTMILLVRYGTGAVTLAPAGGVTINSVGSKKSIATQFEVASLVKIGTDNWMLFGALS